MRVVGRTGKSSGSCKKSKQEEIALNVKLPIVSLSIYHLHILLSLPSISCWPYGEGIVLLAGHSTGASSTELLRHALTTGNKSCFADQLVHCHFPFPSNIPSSVDSPLLPSPFDINPASYTDYTNAVAFTVIF